MTEDRLYSIQLGKWRTLDNHLLPLLATYRDDDALVVPLGIPLRPPHSPLP